MKTTTTNRTCYRCRKQLPLTTVNFRWLDSLDRYHSWCRDCERARARERYKTHKSPERDKRYAITAIRCYVRKYGEGIIKEALTCTH